MNVMFGTDLYGVLGAEEVGADVGVRRAPGALLRAVLWLLVGPAPKVVSGVRTVRPLGYGKERMWTRWSTFVRSIRTSSSLTLRLWVDSHRRASWSLKGWHRSGETQSRSDVILTISSPFSELDCTWREWDSAPSAQTTPSWWTPTEPVVPPSDAERTESFMRDLTSSWLEEAEHLAPEREVIEEANARVPGSGALVLADVSEAVRAAKGMGLAPEEIASMLKVVEEYLWEESYAGAGA